MILSTAYILPTAIAFACLISSAWGWPLFWLWPALRNLQERRNLNTISQIYNLTVYPNQVPILGVGGAAVPPGLFSQDVVGRVDPVGQFLGFEDSIEYFFALAPVPAGNLANAAITSYQITEFTSSCANVAASVVYLYCSEVNPGSPTHGRPLAPLKQIAFWRFDDSGAVVNYDAWIANLDSWVTNTLGFQSADAGLRTASIQGICALTQVRCTGADTQWTSYEQCLTVLSTKAYGFYDEAWGDNIVCRTIHLLLTAVRPDVHCPHIGPTGGGKCVDTAYNDEYFTDQALYGSPVGATFQCDN